MRRAITVVSAVFAVLLLGAPPATAHGGKVKLEVAGDGATGVTVRALYQSDGHPVEDRVLRLTLTATGEGGRTIGPLDVSPAAEGRSFYSSPGILTPGRWTVAVASTDTNVLRSESTVEARAPQTAPTPAATTSTAPNSAPTVDSRPAEGDNRGGSLWTVAFVAALALAGVAVVLVFRRSTKRPPAQRPTSRTTTRPRRRA